MKVRTRADARCLTGNVLAEAEFQAKMRLGTKILILTLAITLALAGLIVWVVTRDLTANETDRAQSDIRRAVSDYFERIESLHAEDFRLVTLLMEDPQNGAQLEALDSGDERAREHFKLLFEDVLQTVLSGGRPGEEAGTPTSGPAAGGAAAPAFHVLLGSDGAPLLTFAPSDAKLSDALSAEKIDWPYEPLLADTPALTRRYVWIDGGLYLALGIPLRIEVSDSPTHAYFIGYRIRDAWAASLLGDARGTGSASDAVNNSARSRKQHRAETPLHAWFVVEGNVVARGSSSLAGAAGYDQDGDDVDGHAKAAAAAESAIGPLAVGTALDVRRPIEFNAGGEKFVGEAVTFPLHGGRRGGLAVASSLTRALAQLHRLQATIAWVTAGVVVIAVLAFRFVSNMIARPIGELVDGTRRIADGEFGTPIKVNRRDELGELASSFNKMAIGIQQRDFVKSTFGKFVDPKVVESFLNDPKALTPGGKKRVQSVLFTDLMGFTSLAEKLDEHDLVHLLNAHLGDAAKAVTGTRGIVDKFIGDAVVAFWGPPITLAEEHAGLACIAALRIVSGVHRLDPECKRLRVSPLGVRVGITTGEVLVGIIGSADKCSYTVIGDDVNLASRVEGLNKLYRTNVLTCARTAAEAKRVVITRRIDRVRVVGRAEPVELFEVLAERGLENPAILLRCEAYAEAMSMYESRAWSAAAAAFKRIVRNWPEDTAADVMAERCDAFQQADPGADWDGVWSATTK
jgi:class 3 adenylate cyclase